MAHAFGENTFLRVNGRRWWCTTNVDKRGGDTWLLLRAHGSVCHFHFFARLRSLCCTAALRASAFPRLPTTPPLYADAVAVLTLSFSAWTQCGAHAATHLDATYKHDRLVTQYFMTKNIFNAYSPSAWLCARICCCATTASMAGIYLAVPPPPRASCGSANIALSIAVYSDIGATILMADSVGTASLLPSYTSPLRRCQTSAATTYEFTVSSATRLRKPRVSNYLLGGGCFNGRHAATDVTAWRAPYALYLVGQTHRN